MSHMGSVNIFIVNSYKKTVLQPVARKGMDILGLRAGEKRFLTLDWMRTIWKGSVVDRNVLPPTILRVLKLNNTKMQRKNLTVKKIIYFYTCIEYVFLNLFPE